MEQIKKGWPSKPSLISSPKSQLRIPWHKLLPVEAGVEKSKRVIIHILLLIDTGYSVRSESKVQCPARIDVGDTVGIRIHTSSSAGTGSPENCILCRIAREGLSG
jgi:hypothetical protein